MSQEPPTASSYDVFISYSHLDEKWVHGWLLPRLESAGLRVCIDYRDFDIGVPSLINMERAAERSRHTLLVLTPSWVKSEWTSFESLLVQTKDPAGLRRRIIPLMLERCELPDRIALFTYANFTESSRWDSELPRLIKALDAQPGQPQPSAATPPPNQQRPAEDAVSQDVQELRDLMAIHRRSLHVLEMQEAQFGIYAPPHVKLQIEDLRKQIAQLDRQIKTLGG
jgi:hypothetical protein